MRVFKIHIIREKYSFGLRARLSILCIKSRSLTYGVLRPANFTSDYIEKKQKVGGNPLRLSMSENYLLFLYKNHALFTLITWYCTSIYNSLKTMYREVRTYTHRVGSSGVVNSSELF